MVRKEEIVKKRVYRCVCNSLFIKREDLVQHIKNKKKGKNVDKHFMGDYSNGGGILFLSTFKEVK